MELKIQLIIGMITESKLPTDIHMFFRCLYKGLDFGGLIKGLALLTN